MKLKAKAERDAADAKYKTATVDGRVEEVSDPVWTWIIIYVPDHRGWAGGGGEYILGLQGSVPGLVEVRAPVWAWIIIMSQAIVEGRVEVTARSRKQDGEEGGGESLPGSLHGQGNWHRERMATLLAAS